MAELKSHEILATLRKEMISWTETTFVWPITSSEVKSNMSGKVSWKEAGASVDPLGNLTKMYEASFSVSTNISIGKHVCSKIPRSDTATVSFATLGGVDDNVHVNNVRLTATENQGVLQVKYSCNMSVLNNDPPTQATVSFTIGFYTFKDTLVVNQTTPFIAIDGYFGNNTDDNNKILFSGSRNFSFKNGVGLIATHDSNTTSFSLTSQGAEWISQNWEDTSGCEVWIAGLGYR